MRTLLDSEEDTHSWPVEIASETYALVGRTKAFSGGGCSTVGSASRPLEALAKESWPEIDFASLEPYVSYHRQSLDEARAEAFLAVTEKREVPARFWEHINESTKDLPVAEMKFCRVEGHGGEVGYIGWLVEEERAFPISVEEGELLEDRQLTGKTRPREEEGEFVGGLRWPFKVGDGDYRVEWAGDQCKRARMTGFCDAQATLETLLSHPRQLFGVEKRSYERVPEEVLESPSSASSLSSSTSSSELPLSVTSLVRSLVQHATGGTTSSATREVEPDKRSHVLKWAALAAAVAVVAIGAAAAAAAGLRMRRS